MRQWVVVLLLSLLAPAAHALGGDFSLTDQHRREFKLSEHRDKVVLLFFGYTHCPDICPDTLSTVSAALTEVENTQDIQVVFVTVDPARDTPDHLKAYLAYFDQRYLGLSGTEKQILDVARLWNARFKKTGQTSSSGNFIDHSADIYVIERGGSIHSVVPYGLPSSHLSKVIRGALAQTQEASLSLAGLYDLQGHRVAVLNNTKPVLLHFWASWCAPCRTEFLDLERARRRVEGLSADFFAVNLGDRKQGIEAFLQDYPLSHPVLMDRGGFSQAQWQIKALPQTLLLDAQGNLSRQYIGPQPWAESVFLDELERSIGEIIN